MKSIPLAEPTGLEKMLMEIGKNLCAAKKDRGNTAEGNEKNLHMLGGLIDLCDGLVRRQHETTDIQSPSACCGAEEGLFVHELPGTIAFMTLLSTSIQCPVRTVRRTPRASDAVPTNNWPSAMGIKGILQGLRAATRQHQA